MPAKTRWTRLLAAMGVLTSVAASAHPARAQSPCTSSAPSARAWPAPLDRPVTLRTSAIPLRDALDRLSAAARVRLSYASDVVPLDRRVCVRAERQALGDVLAALVGSFQVEPRVISAQVALVPAAPAKEAAPSIQQSVNVLDGIVVTGSPAGNSRRSLTVALGSVDGTSLERRGASTVSQVLNSAAPGVWAWNTSPSSLLAQYGSVRGASSFGATYPKVYVDGVEAANPLLVTEIDPDVVERVEVIRGPQGAALYGSDAISGVVNIVTRYADAAGAGMSVDVRSRGGVTASDYSSAPLPTHEERISVRTGTNLRSAGAALTVGGTGAIFPGADSRTVSAAANGRWVAGNAIGTATLRFTDRRAGSGRNPLVEALDTALGGSVVDAGRQALQRYTVGTSATLAPNGPWTHTFLAGVDGYRLDHVVDAASPFPMAADSALRSAGGSGARGTLRASSTLQLAERGDASGTLTLAVEHSVLRVRAAAEEESEPGDGGHAMLPQSTVVESWRHNTGVLAQTRGAWRNTVFGTAGLRVERNDAFTGGSYAALPMLGAAVVRPVAGAEVKLRAAYGRGIRPARTTVRVHMRGGDREAVQGVLDPETQAGFEFGAELYAGKRFSLQVTRFDQKATGLIQDVAVGIDTFAWQPPNAREPRDRELRRVRYQLQNVGAITNRGWEVQTSLARGPFALSGTLAVVDSRVRTLAAGYAGDLLTGDRVLAVPARTATLGAEWEDGPWSASMTAARAWDWINYDRVTLARDFTTDTPLPRDIMGVALRQYWREYDGSTDLRATLTRQLSVRLSLTAAADNLLGTQVGEPDNATIRAGRSLTLGARARF